MRRGLISILVFAMMSVLLTGCGSKKLPTESELEIGKKGTVTSTLVESFEKDFYNLDEFREMATSEIAFYNESAAEERILLKQLELLEGNCIAVLEYQSPEDYARFNETSFFAGTVKEAQEAGVDFNVVLTETCKDTTIGPAETAKLEEYHLVVWNGEMMVRVPEKILYHSSNVELLGSKRAIGMQATNGEALADQNWEDIKKDGPFYLLYK